MLRTDSSNPDFVELISRLNELLAVLNGEQNEFYEGQNKLEPASPAVVAFVRGRAVGCGALRLRGQGEVEIKRMYVDPAYRGQGIGLCLLGELEAMAVDLGANNAVLETSRRLDAALSLYLKAGYLKIPNYGPYAHIEDSVCMAKDLA